MWNKFHSTCSKGHMRVRMPVITWFGCCSVFLQLNHITLIKAWSWTYFDWATNVMIVLYFYLIDVLRNIMIMFSCLLHLCKDIIWRLFKMSHFCSSLLLFIIELLWNRITCNGGYPVFNGLYGEMLGFTCFAITYF